ncbi:MAG: hypothetical protein Q4F11_00030 [Eubacteriales bacterium]|nr:hypothetical protein [Eubacteriales bacterium]
MKYLSGILQMVACEVNFYDAESYQGDSIVPFLCFMGSLAGLVFVIVGVAKYSMAKHNWNIFYDRRDQRETDEKKLKNDLKYGRIMIIAGVIMMVVFYIATM